MVSGTLENRSRRDVISFSRCGLVKTSVCFFVHLIITNILEPINLFQLFRCNRHRWLIMVSVHYGLKRGTPTYVCVCVCVYNRNTQRRYEVAVAASACAKTWRDSVNRCVSVWALRGQRATHKEKKEKRKKRFIQMNQHNCWGGRIVDGGRRREGGPENSRERERRKGGGWREKEEVSGTFVEKEETKRGRRPSECHFLRSPRRVWDDRAAI